MSAENRQLRLEAAKRQARVRVVIGGVVEEHVVYDVSDRLIYTSRPGDYEGRAWYHNGRPVHAGHVSDELLDPSDAIQAYIRKGGVVG